VTTRPFTAGLAAIIGIATIAATLAAQGAAESERFWPQWRGPFATGVSKSADPPLQWSETRNVRWKVEIPGRGSASPVVWGDRIYLLTAVDWRAGEAAHARGEFRATAIAS
jgi:hypothetical protein